MFYGNGLFVRQRYPFAFRHPEDEITTHLSAAGAASLLALVWTLVPDVWVAAAWGVLGFTLVVVGTATRGTTLVRHASLVSLAVGVHAIAVNLYGASHVATPWTRPLVTVGAAALALIAALPLARRHGVGPSSFFDVWRRPDRALFFVPFVMTAWMLAATLDASLVTMAWGTEAVVAVLFALWLRDRSFRLSALGLLLAAVARIGLVDVWRLQPQGRYFAFIGLGLALLLVSYLYSRYHARLKEFL